MILSKIRETPMLIYSFCESIHAGSNSRWHIRPLLYGVRRLGGGIETEGLCGRPEKGKGWDLDVEITDHHLTHCCPKCAEIFRIECGR